jgi:uncharacterized protein YecA (UPF0149 family)
MEPIEEPANTIEILMPKGYEYAEKDADKRKGYTFKRKYTLQRNQACPCGSGKKFKNCHMVD